jgi:dTDP-4-amino-4,6-dideoxygalactose transaminase
MPIPFNKPYIPWLSLRHLVSGAFSGKIAGNGVYTKKCHRFFEQRFGFGKVLMTTSCSDALEMTALLCRIEPGDEVIMPSFTFMSTANAFLLRGARIVFADTLRDVPNIDPAEIGRLITPKTKAVVVVHYSGIACDMDRIMEIAKQHDLYVVEDAAHAIDSYYRGSALGSIGHFGTFSFHETKNIISGEGGLLIVNRPEYEKRAEIIWEKGTNRAAFYRGEIDKYGWVDVGSSYLPSDAVAALLYSQLTRFDAIQNRRKAVWHNYFESLKPPEEKGWLKRPVIPDFATVNGNIFYITVESGDIRDQLMAYLKSRGITALFHYLPLHSSPYFLDRHHGRALPNTDRFSATLLRLPFYNSLRKSQINNVSGSISAFFQSFKQLDDAGSPG